MWPVEPLKQIVLSEPKLLWEQKGTVKSASHPRARLCHSLAPTSARGPPAWGSMASDMVWAPHFHPDT